MANYFPVALVNGTMDVMDSTTVVNPTFFPVSRSIAATSNSFSTRLPDPYFIQTLSADISVSVNGVSSSVMSFTVPTRQEQQYYISEALLAVSTVSSSVTGPKISVNRANLADGYFRIQTATGLTAVSTLNQGTKDVEATASMATTVANNAPVPVIMKGIFSNSTSQGTFNNAIYVQTSASINVTVISGSVFSNHFAGLSSSLAPFTSSRAPIALISGTLDSIAGGDLINQSCLPATKSLWTTQGSTTANSVLLSTVSSSSATTWTTVFTLNGMTDGKRYLVNAFLRASTLTASTACYVRAASASNYTGVINLSLNATNNTVYSVGTSSGSDQIANRSSTGISSIRADRVYPSEYTLTKATGLNPTIEIQSAVAGGTVYIQSGSVVLWRSLE